MKEILKWVEGNPFGLAIPLEKEVFSGGMVTHNRYEPPAGSVVTVTLVGGCPNKKYTARLVDGNVAVIHDDGTLGVGTYDVEVKVVEPDGTPRRSMWPKQVRIVRNNGEVVKQWDEFAEMEGELLTSAVFMAAEGPQGPQGEKGEKGDPGRDGADGRDGRDGVDGQDGQPGQDGRDGADGQPGRDGRDGADGRDGVTPHIDATTKHWMIGTTDTGILAEGTDGVDGNDGQDGSDGISVTNVAINSSGHLIVALSEGNPIDAGVAKGDDGNPGSDGVGISSIAFKETDANGNKIYTITLTNENTYDFTAPMGPASAADINLSGSVISVTNNAGQTSSIDVLSSADERVAIAVTTDVQGVSVSGLAINVYYNDASVPSATVTTDANGMASLRVPNMYKYRLVFPSVEGCKSVPDVVHTAAVSQRSVEVEYVEDANADGELVKVVLTQKTGETISKISGATVKITVDGATTDYTTNSQGIAMATIPYGKQYSVTAPQRDGWYLHENRYTLTQTANQTGRVLLYTYRQYDSGLFIVASDGVEYTLEQWESAVEGGTRENSEAVLIKVSTGALVQAGGVFAVNIDHLRSRSYGANKAWASQNVQFNSIPLNGNSASANYYYDGLTSSRLVQQEGDERAIDTLAVDKCLALNFKLAEGTEDELVLPGFLGSVGQWKELWLNAAEVDDILLSTRPSGSYLLSTLTTQKWTSTQGSANSAYYWGPAASGNNKGSSYVVLPFFAY